MKILILVFSFTSLSLPVATNPPTLLMIIIAQTLTTCLLIWLISSTSWFSFILFLIFVGGLMVLFIYITSLASNEMFQPSNPLSPWPFYFILTMILLGGLALLKAPQNNAMLSYSPLAQTEIIFDPANMMITLAVMTYLLITLIVVVKIAGKMEGPMRHSMKIHN